MIDRMTQWHIARCNSGKETAGQDVLQNLGASETFVPVEKVRISERVRKALRKKGKPAKTHKTVCWAPGYIFFRAEYVDLHKINGHHPGKVWLRVMTSQDRPRAVSEAEFLKMKALPETAGNLIAAAEAAERAERLARLPKLGERAIITGGPFSGVSGDVLEIHRDQIKVGIGAHIIAFPVQQVERAAT